MMAIKENSCSLHLFLVLQYGTSSFHHFVVVVIACVVLVCRLCSVFTIGESAAIGASFFDSLIIWCSITDHVLLSSSGFIFSGFVAMRSSPRQESNCLGSQE